MKTRHVTAVLALMIFLIGTIGVGNQVEASNTTEIRSSLLEKLAHKFKDTFKAAKSRILGNSKKWLSYKETIPNIQDVVDKAVTRGDKIFSKFAIVQGKALSNLNRAGKIVMGHTFIEMMHLRNKSWSNIVKAMDQNHLLVRYPGSKTIKIYEHKMFWSMDHVSGMFNSTTKPNIYKWYKNVLNSSGVLSDIPLQQYNILSMMYNLKGTIKSWITDFIKLATNDIPFMDVVVMKILDVKTPHFQIYRLDLKMVKHVGVHSHATAKEIVFIMKFESHKYFFRTDLAKKLPRVAQTAALKGLKLLAKVNQPKAILA